MAKEKRVWIYKGSVKHYDEIVIRNWYAETHAVSEKQAANNILMQFKRKIGATVDSVYQLCGNPKLKPIQPYRAW